ncbi:hypothetical protein V5N11_021431 [Cardamine amara subsp. amara]|uniref:Uncharacterized protein n=1 Tax=Cardamine amara subsp. amara TaxID=228776 RepID=A0ABD1BDW8_CARAN
MDAGDANGFAHSSTKVDYHLNNLLASHLSNPDLTPQEIAEASRSTAAAAAIAAKAARANADEKAAAAAKAVAAAKSALDLIASFPNQAVFQDNVPAHLLYSKDEELPSKLQLGDDRQGIIPNSSSSSEHKYDQCKVPIGSGEHANSKKVDVNGLGIELDSNILDESAGGEVAKQGRKRGRPKSIK